MKNILNLGVSTAIKDGFAILLLKDGDTLDTIFYNSLIYCTNDKKLELLAKALDSIDLKLINTLLLSIEDAELFKKSMYYSMEQLTK